MVAVVERLEVGEDVRAVGPVEAVLRVDVVDVLLHLGLREADEIQKIRIQVHDRADVKTA